MNKKTATKIIGAAALCIATLGQAEDKTINAILITGEGHHDYENQKRILSEGISERLKINWTIKHHKKAADARSDLSQPCWADGQDIVIYNICHASESDKAFVEGVCKVHHDGLPAIALHCSMHSYNWRIEGEPKDKEWNKFIGVFSKNHGPKAGITVKKTDVDHPITKDMPAEWSTAEGELYNILHVQDSSTILAHGDNGKANGPQPLVWVNQYGKAKVFGTTLGHHNSTMENPLYLDMISNAISWAIEK